MGIWGWLFVCTDNPPTVVADMGMPCPMQSTANPATGLPMVGGDTFGVDVGGSPYGSNLYDPGSCSDMGGSHGWPD
jgi:hypothetical protein